jgi:methylamine---glutamate N-methyltransferase subunit A
MCGIMGYFDKTGRRDAKLGATMLRMLTALGRRGPDSTGVALYTNRADGAHLMRVKLGEPAEVEARAAEVLRRVRTVARIYEHEHTGAYLRLALDFAGDPQALLASIEDVHPEIEVISFGRALDLVKQVGSPHNLDRRFGISQAHGTHAIAHTRLSTESRIDLSHSQPFWAHGALDVASAHNGHITNYHKLRRQYEQRGVRFYTENDSEIIGIYLYEAMQAGATFAEALRSSVQFFDGSFSYLAATASEIGFAKDPFGFKPLIVAESDAFVAIATEELALHAACGGEVETWEPLAGTVQTWNVCQERAHNTESHVLEVSVLRAP